MMTHHPVPLAMRLEAPPTPLIVLVSVLLATPALAGCLGSDAPGGGDGVDPEGVVKPDQAALAEAPPFSTLLCVDGYRLAPEATGGNASGVCNHRVTRPLEDPGRLDVVTQHGPANEVSIAVNPLDPLNAAGGAKDYTVSYVSDVAECGEYTVWMGTFHTMDGGLTWSNDLMRGFPGDERASPLAGNACNTDPVLVFDDDGTLWYSGLNYGGARDDRSTVTNPVSGHDAFSGSQIYFARSPTAGRLTPR